jgi:hypothetical protein
MFDKVLFGLIGVFLFLYGLLHVTNVKIEWMEPICGFCALVAGVICIIRDFR